jgi:hypothetical protein
MTFALWFFGAFALLGLGIATIWGTRTILFARETRSWPSAPGVIEHSQIVLESGDQHGNSYRPIVSYRYSVDGVAYTGSLIACGLGHYSGSEKFARRFFEKYPESRKVEVYYDPFRSERCVLEPGVTRYAFYPMGFGLLFFACGSAFWAMVWHKSIAGH